MRFLRQSGLWPAFALLGAALTSGCDEGGVRTAFVVATPHDRYEAKLRQAGLDEAALGRDWIAAASRALETPVGAELPFRESSYLDPAEASAVAYRVTLRRGQRLAARVDLDAEIEIRSPQLFVDLFFTPPGVSMTPTLVSSAGSTETSLEYVVPRPGDYLLRIQPELLRGGRLTVTFTTHASLAFPVQGKTTTAIRSGFGAPRDLGRREHHGVDIFAPRGTPVLAATEGVVTRVGNSGLGGKIVWLRDRKHSRSLYYAHLDRHAVMRNARVKPGDTLGFVGNTGNARTTRPHLHFGIYVRRTGPVDPYPHLYEPDEHPPSFQGEMALLGEWARAWRSETTLRSVPDADGAVIATIAQHTPIRVVAGNGRWYRVRLPNGSAGYVAVAATEPASVPIRMERLAEGSMVRIEPTQVAAAVDTVRRGAELPVLGSYGKYLLVESPSGLTGWLDSP